MSKNIDSLDDTDNIDINKLIADIEWDILEKNSELGIAKLNVYAVDQDLEMLLFFAISTFIVFQKYMQARKTQTYAMVNFWMSKR